MSVVDLTSCLPSTVVFVVLSSLPFPVSVLTGDWVNRLRFWVQGKGGGELSLLLSLIGKACAFFCWQTEVPCKRGQLCHQAPPPAPRVNLFSGFCFFREIISRLWPWKVDAWQLGARVAFSCVKTVSSLPFWCSYIPEMALVFPFLRRTSLLFL